VRGARRAKGSSWSQVLLFNTALLPDPTSTSCMVLKGELFRHDTQPDPQECACWAARDVHHERPRSRQGAPDDSRRQRNRGAADARDALTPRARARVYADYGPPDRRATKDELHIYSTKL
jgi:hypothetical protein